MSGLHLPQRFIIARDHSVRASLASKIHLSVIWQLLFPILALGSAIVFCYTVSADRTMLAVSRFLAASAKCAIVLSFVAEGHSSYWSACLKVPLVVWQLLFSILWYDTSVCQSFSV